MRTCAGHHLARGTARPRRAHLRLSHRPGRSTAWAFTHVRKTPRSRSTAGLPSDSALSTHRRDGGGAACVQAFADVAGVPEQARHWARGWEQAYTSCPLERVPSSVPGIMQGRVLGNRVMPHVLLAVAGFECDHEAARSHQRSWLAALLPRTAAALRTADARRERGMRRRRAAGPARTPLPPAAACGRSMILRIRPAAAAAESAASPRAAALPLPLRRATCPEAGAAQPRAGTTAPPHLPERPLERRDGDPWGDSEGLFRGSLSGVATRLLKRCSVTSVGDKLVRARRRRPPAPRALRRTAFTARVSPPRPARGGAGGRGQSLWVTTRLLRQGSSALQAAEGSRIESQFFPRNNIPANECRGSVRAPPVRLPAPL